MGNYSLLYSPNMRSATLGLSLSLPVCLAFKDTPTKLRLGANLPQASMSQSPSPINFECALETPYTVCYNICYIALTLLGNE